MTLSILSQSHHMSPCTAARWHPAASRSSPPPQPDFGTVCPEDHCVHCLSQPSCAAGSAAAGPPRMLLRCNDQSPILPRCCRRGCHCCRPRTRQTRRRISAGSRTWSGPLRGETAPSARTPPSLSNDALQLIWSGHALVRRTKVCLSFLSDWTTPKRRMVPPKTPGSKHTGQNVLVNRCELSSLQGYWNIYAPCSLYSAAHWAIASCSSTASAFGRSSEIFLSHTNKERV